MAGTAANYAVVHRSRGVVRIEVTCLTDASGDMSAAVIGDAFGRLVAVAYNGGLDASAVVSLKDAGTGVALFVKTTGTEGVATYERPTIGVSTVAGAVVTAADTAPNVNRDIYAAGKLTLTVASGGNVETGIIAFIFDEAGLGEKALTV